MDLIFELPHSSEAEAKRPSAQAVYELLKSAILAGELAPGCRLPPTRASSERFGLSRGTMVAIYERLATEDLIEARRGSGTFIARRPNRDYSPNIQGDMPAPPAWLAESLGRRTHHRQCQSPQIQASDEIELRPGLVDPKLFPFDKFRRSMAKALRQMERSPAIYESRVQSQGDPRFRRTVADHATLMRAIVCDPDSILATSGVQQAFELLACTLVESDSTVVAFEEPSFKRLVEPFIKVGAKVRRVAVDREGIVVELIPEDAKIVCVSPSSQFPLGVAMSSRRRQELYAFARERNVLIIEDDYGGEMRTGGEPLKTLYSHDPSRVFYVGTFSTCMFPSFRLGFLISPQWALGPLLRIKRHSDWQSAPVVEAAAACFITDGYLSAHIARMRTIYRDRKAALVKAIDANFGDILHPVPSAYGLHVAAIGNPVVDWDSVASRAQSAGIQIRSLAQYYTDIPTPGLLFGVGVEPEDRLQTAAATLATMI